MEVPVPDTRRFLIPHTELSEATGDSLNTPEVGSWAEDKYRLLRNYATLFATSMKARWDMRIYIDLFAGPGKVRIQGTARVVKASPLIALEIPDPFDRYIFCEENSPCLAALKTRVATLHPSRDVHFLLGDTNRLAEKILEAMPPYGPRKRVLAFCFADPFKLQNLQFSTIRALAKRYMDFLVLLPTGMDANRNWQRYMNPSSTTVDLFVGTSEWREATEKNLPLYRLGFFSRHPLGQKFWDETRKYSQDQRDLLFD